MAPPAAQEFPPRTPDFLGITKEKARPPLKEKAKPLRCHGLPISKAKFRTMVEAQLAHKAAAVATLTSKANSGNGTR